MKSIDVSQHFVVCSTGSQVKILDQALNLIATVGKVQYVYNCIISPDEKTLLLVSTANFFYVVSLTTFEMRKITIKGKYSENLEGRGCFTLDGKGGCFCVCDRNTILSALRVYDDFSSDEYRDLLCDKYWLTSVSPVPQLNKYLLTGLDRKNHISYLIWYNGSNFEEYPLYGLGEFNTAVGVKYDEENDLCIVKGMNSTAVCTTDGKLVESVHLPHDTLLEYSFSNIFQKVELKDESREKIKSLSNQFGLENLQVPDTILDICYSKKGPYLFIATMQKLLCLNTETNAVEAEIEVPYGVQNILKVNEELLLISTWESVKLIRVIFDT